MGFPVHLNCDHKDFLIIAVVCLFGLIPCAAQPVAADHHQHLFSPEIAKLSPSIPVVTAADLIAHLDKAGIRKAVVLSVAYMYGNPNRPAVENEYDKVRAENDWTSAQVALYPDRLRGFCGVNPLKEYAVREIERCAKETNLRYGLKLHFGNSDVILDRPGHIEALRRVFRTANANRMAIVIHLRSSVTNQSPYGAKQVRNFVEQVLREAPDVPVQVAHMAGHGGYDDPVIDEAFQVLVEARVKKDPRVKNLWVDASGVAGIGEWQARAELIAKRLREFGLDRVLYGSDGAVPGNLPVEVLARFRQLPLTEAEFRQIESNVAPYLRGIK